MMTDEVSAKSTTSATCLPAVVSQQGNAVSAVSLFHALSLEATDL